MEKYLDKLDIQTKEKFEHDYKKSLGQNFLFDKNLLLAIANDADVTKEDIILEIGAGAGTLTEILIEKAKKVISFEVDKTLFENLNKLKGAHANIEFVFEDFMKADLDALLKDYDKVKVVANIPYYITTEIIFKLVSKKEKFSEILVLVQKEVAERFSSKLGTKNYGITSVVLQSIFDVTMPRIVNKVCFTPSPKVDSAVCKLIPNDKYKIDDFDDFSKFVSNCFSMRRKTLINNLKEKYLKEKIINSLKKLNYVDTVRPEEISVENFVKLFNFLNY